MNTLYFIFLKCYLFHLVSKSTANQEIDLTCDCPYNIPFGNTIYADVNEIIKLYLFVQNPENQSHEWKYSAEVKCQVSKPTELYMNRRSFAYTVNLCYTLCYNRGNPSRGILRVRGQNS